MTDNMFDNFVRDKLQDHQSAVPQGLWDKIERKKDREPKGGFWLPKTAMLVALLIILSSLGVGYYLLKDSEQPTAANTGSSETAAANKGNDATGNEQPATNSTNATTGNDQNQNTNNNGTPTGNALSNGDDDGAQTTQSNIQKQSNNNNQVVTDVPSTEKKKKGKKPAKQNNQVNDVTNNGLVYSNLNKKGNKRSTGLNLNTTGAGNQIIKDERSGDDKSNSTAVTPSPVQTLNLLSKGQTAYNFKPFSLTSKDQFNLSELKIVGIDCPTAGMVRRNDWYLEVFGSRDFTMKSVTAKNNTAYVQKKDSTETQQGGFTAGFRISKSIGENLLVKTGLQYSQINERFDLRTENERRITTVITIRTVITPGGTDSTVRDTTTLEQIGYRLQRTYNRYRSIDVPILLSYEFGNDKLKFAVNGGVILNIYSWYKGEALNDSMNVVSLNSKSKPIYKQNIGLGLYAEFSIIKPISGKFDLFLEPYFRYNLSNMATGSGYSQKFNAMGINLGIRYQLKGQRKGVK